MYLSFYIFVISFVILFFAAKFYHNKSFWEAFTVALIFTVTDFWLVTLGITNIIQPNISYNDVVHVLGLIILGIIFILDKKGPLSW